MDILGRVLCGFLPLGCSGAKGGIISHPKRGVGMLGSAGQSPSNQEGASQELSTCVGPRSLKDVRSDWTTSPPHSADECTHHHTPTTRRLASWLCHLFPLLFISHPRPHIALLLPLQAISVVCSRWWFQIHLIETPERSSQARWKDETNSATDVTRRMRELVGEFWD